MADGYVQVPVDSTGKKIDTLELTRSDNVIVERQRVDIPLPISIDGAVAQAILNELRLANYLLCEILSNYKPNQAYDIEQARAEQAIY